MLLDHLPAEHNEHDESAASPVLLDHLPAEHGVIIPPEHHDPAVHRAPEHVLLVDPAAE